MQPSNEQAGAHSVMESEGYSFSVNGDLGPLSCHQHCRSVYWIRQRVELSEGERESNLTSNAAAAPESRGPRDVAEHLPFLSGDKSPTGSPGFKA